MENWSKYVTVAKAVGLATVSALAGAGLVPDPWHGFLLTIFGG